MNILIYGLGGHGFEPLSMLLNNPNIVGRPSEPNTLHFLQSPSDFGGATGIICRLFSHNNKSLDRKLHGPITSPNFPWGDYNQLIGFYIGLRHPECKASYLERCNNINQLMVQFELFATCIKADQDFKNDFEFYVAEIFSYAQNVGIKIKDITIAHFFNCFLFSQCKSMDKFNKYYQDLNILPPNCFLHFVSSSRLVLHATDILGSNLQGEDEIDEHKFAIAPHSFKLTHPNGKSLSSDEIASIVNLVNSSDFIIFPNGSDANRNPITNIQEVAQALALKSIDEKVIQFMNLFHKRNEIEFDTHLGYLEMLGIKPIVVGPTMDIHLEDSPLNKSYKIQNKKPNPLPTYYNTYIPWLDLVVGGPTGPVEGLKYHPDSILKFLRAFIKI